MTLWTAQDAATATGGRAVGDWSVNGISIDTRTIETGDLFVALKAARDGHEFVAQALGKGAGAALVTHAPEGVAQDAPLLIVADVLSALEDLGRAGRARTDARVVAITGSVGKTSTKEMLRDVLGAQGRTHASVASYNNHWGVPLTLARMPANTEFAVIEIGMNHPGEIAPLAGLARPHVAMITTVAPAHMEAFESIEGIAVEKAAIIEGLEDGGIAILNADIDTAHVLENAAETLGVKALWFGQTATDYVLDKIVLSGNTTVVQASVQGAPLLYKVQTAGQHFAMNGLGALACAQALGADLALAAQGIANWTPFTGRGAREVIALDPADTRMTLELIDDAYNANPTSLSAALDVLAAAEVTHDIGRVSKGRRIAYLGDMKELGSSEIQMHQAVAALPSTTDIDLIHCVGPLMRHCYDALPEAQRGHWTETSTEMATHVGRDLDAGDVVLAKGSLSMGLARLVDAVRKLGHTPTKDAQKDDV
ncbi:UDP-N-acetylmuramoyl-tripeptide--D-alanyl-D-alanine ligase [Planktotalea sp.]|uniref:UDP-N-acetylmuramoyl-tripeptide--D-alanyl-D- alanine ligase n=1 Tax=Planktotalea sp. TaxID=2029877 RepID=UPI0025D03D3B|nr:UDP-N-acetylmuramoyl-tripeptide--D-alanyl-D-alanine ligase [Planktotalea sp.]